MTFRIVILSTKKPGEQPGFFVDRGVLKRHIFTAK